MIDLHIHTKYSSDGVYEPYDIFRFALEKNIKIISFTDHNEVKANFEGFKLCDSFGISYVSGAEFNSYYKGKDIHILGYFIDFKQEKLNELIKFIKSQKNEQTLQRVEKLQGLGFYVDSEKVFKEAGGKPPTGVSFLKAILKDERNAKNEILTPYISGEKSRSPFMNFYNDFFKPDKPAFVNIKDLESEKIISAILNAKGIPVIAHPKDLSFGDLSEFKSLGVMGVEVWSSYHDLNARKIYSDFAEKLKLVKTAGSDFHGETIKKDVRFGDTNCDENGIFEKLIERYKEYYGKEPDNLRFRRNH